MNSAQALLALLLAASVSFPSIASADDWAICAGSSFGEPVAASIDACARWLATGQGTLDDRANALFYRGYALNNAGRPSEALSDLRASLELRPTAVAVLQQTGVAYFKLGDNRRALVHFTESLRYKPDYNQALAGRAVVYEAMGDLDDARADYQAILSIPLSESRQIGIAQAQSFARIRLNALKTHDGPTPTPSGTPSVRDDACKRYPVMCPR
jgi:tetratricopeptide (TPR) repeat protein